MNYIKSVFLYVDEILHDIDAELMKFSRLISNGGEVNHELQSDELSDSRPLMLRRISYCIGQLQGVMQPYIVDVDKSAVGNTLTSDSEYEFTLSFPENWKRSAFVRLPLEMHNYIVNSCISDYLKSSMPQESSAYDESSRKNLWNVKHCVTVRVPESMRLPQSMF